jgi:hypothetical protein
MPKKPKRVTKSVFSVAMSQETGCIVMVRTNGHQVTVIGSLKREESLGFADSVIDWEAAPEPEKLSADEQQSVRPAYPH